MNDSRDLEDLFRLAVNSIRESATPAHIIKRKAHMKNVRRLVVTGGCLTALSIGVLAVVPLNLRSSQRVVTGHSSDNLSRLPPTTVGDVNGGVPFEEAEISDDRLSITVRFIGMPPYNPSDPCTGSYEAHAEPKGEVLSIQITHSVTMAPCDGISSPREVRVRLKTSFSGSEVLDASTGRVVNLIGRKG